MGTGQFSPLSPPRRPGRQRLSRSRDGKGQGLARLAPCCHGSTSPCQPANILGAWRWLQTRRRSRCHPKGGWQFWRSALSPPWCLWEDAAGSKPLPSCPAPCHWRWHSHGDGVPEHSPSQAPLGGQGDLSSPCAEQPVLMPPSRNKKAMFILEGKILAVWLSS